MAISPEQLKSLRKKYGYTQEDAAKTVRVGRRTWMSWELAIDTENHRDMPEGLLELFCIKHKIEYTVVDTKIHIVYI